MKKSYLITKVSFITFIFVFFATITNAANYYASPTGSGTGTLESPCSFASGLTKLTTAGDTLFLRGGQYDLSAKVSINKSGTANARICIWNYPSETPILDFRGEVYGEPGISLANTSSFMHIKGLTVRYAGDNGIVNNGNNHIIDNCVFYGNCDSGLQHKTGGSNLIKNCDSHHNFDYQSGTLAVPDFGGNADGFADKQYTNASGNTYEGCRSWNNSDDGWDFYQRVGVTIIKNSICYKNGPANYNMTNHPRATTDATWFANFSASELASYKNYGNANGFKLGGDYTVNDVILTNCLAVGNNARGFDQNNNYGTMTIYNSSAYDNVINYGFGTNSGGTLIVKNSASLSSRSANSFACKTVTNTNNSWNTSGVTCNASDFISLDSTVILTNRQADGSLPNTVFMQLADGSDLIDAGVNVSLPYSGTAPDLGCYERGNLDQYPPAVTTPTNKDQSIIEGNAITDIVFTWSAGATSLTICDLPNGLAAMVSQTNKTLTISGSPTTPGVYSYTVTSIGGSGSAINIIGTIAVSSATAKKIAYVTTPNNAADAKILEKLNANVNFNVTILDATTTNVYTGYDLIVLSSVPNSSSAGLAAIEAVNKPKLLLKPFQLGSTRWNWGTAANTTASSITVSNTSHEIFNGISFTGSNSLEKQNNELQLFSTVTTNGVTGITSWVGTPVVISLATATSITTTTQSIVEIPVGTNMNGTTTTQRFLMIGVSESSTANLTTSATQLIENACYYLMSTSIPTNVAQINAKKSNYSLIQEGNNLLVKGTETITALYLFTPSGILLNKVLNKNSISLNNLPKSVYIVSITNENGVVSVQKFVKR